MSAVLTVGSPWAEGPLPELFFHVCLASSFFSLNSKVVFSPSIYSNLPKFNSMRKAYCWCNVISKPWSITVIFIITTTTIIIIFFSSSSLRWWEHEPFTEQFNVLFTWILISLDYSTYIFSSFFWHWESNSRSSACKAGHWAKFLA